MPSLGINERAQNARQTIRREATIFRGVVRDVQRRFGKKTQEPRAGHKAGGILGKQGSLAKAPVTLLVDSADNVVKHIQRMAQINRKLVR